MFTFKADNNHIMKQSIQFVVLVCLACLLAGCSYLNLEIEPSAGSISTQDDGLTSVRTGEDLSYYYFDQTISLGERQDMVFVKISDDQSKFLTQITSGVSALSLYNSQATNSRTMGVAGDTFLLQSSSPAETDRQIGVLKANPSVVFASKVLEYEGHLVGVSDEFSVKLKTGTSRSELDRLAARFACTVSQRDFFEDDIFFVKVDKTSEFGVLQLSSIFYETGLFEFTSPDFISFDAFGSQDPYYQYQWNLKNTGQYSTALYDINIESAWTVTEGSSDIIVAVLDNGVLLTHPDLAANIVTGYDCVQNISGGAPTSAEEKHGTPVAGIIAAVKDNGIGISGVAPGCKILPVRIGDSQNVYSSTATSGFNWAVSQGADVINCSWGLSNPCSLLTAAIQNATTQGRDGKGCVVIFSSGNKKFGDNDPVLYPGSLSYVMAVGAISYNGQRKNLSTPDGENWWSSNYGGTLDVMAPGVYISTTDVNGGYQDRFNGTSAAAPQVAGVAALILSKYPDLPQEYVRRAIEKGCDHLPGYTYTTDGQYPPLTRNNEVGYGLVNARDALMYAEQFKFQNDTDQTSGFDFVISNSTIYDFDEMIFDVMGKVNGVFTYLVSANVLGGLERNSIVGYPVYRGCDISSGTAITDIEVRLYAVCSDYSGYFDIGVAIDNPFPNSYDAFSFSSDGDTYETTLPSTSVPDGGRRKVYVKIYETVQNQ